MQIDILDLMVCSKILFTMIKKALSFQQMDKLKSWSQHLEESQALLLMIYTIANLLMMNLTSSLMEMSNMLKF